jgi:hypothetical protein
MSDDRDPRFLGGQDLVLTDARDMALVIAISHEGVLDVQANVPKKQAAFWLREVADRWDPPVEAADHISAESDQVKADWVKADRLFEAWHSSGWGAEEVKAQRAYKRHLMLMHQRRRNEEDVE